MKVREKRTWTQGMGGPHPQERIRELQEGEETPAGAEAVPDDTEVHDWRPLPLIATPEEVKTNG